MRDGFIGFGIIGVVLISILAFSAENAWEIIPALSMASFDAPLCIKVILGGGGLYLMTLYSIYDYLVGEE